MSKDAATMSKEGVAASGTAGANLGPTGGGQFWSSARGKRANRNASMQLRLDRLFRRNE